MGVANTKSTQITNSDSTTSILGVPNDTRTSDGAVKESVATVEVAAADDDGSVYRFVRVWSGWRLKRILVWNDALTAGTSWKCGLYNTARLGGAAVDDNCFADAVDLSSASPLGFDMLFQTNDFANIEKKVWEIPTTSPTLTLDPQRFWDICLTATTVGSAAGTLSMSVEYVAGA